MPSYLLSAALLTARRAARGGRLFRNNRCGFSSCPSASAWPSVRKQFVGDVIPLQQDPFSQRTPSGSHWTLYR